MLLHIKTQAKRKTETQPPALSFSLGFVSVYLCYNCRLIPFSRQFCCQLLSGLQCSYVLDHVPDLPASVPTGREAVPGAPKAGARGLAPPTPQPPSEADIRRRRRRGADLVWRPGPGRGHSDHDGIGDSDIYHESLGSRYTDPCRVRERV